MVFGTDTGGRCILVYAYTWTNEHVKGISFSQPLAMCWLAAAVDFIISCFIHSPCMCVCVLVVCHVPYCHTQEFQCTKCPWNVRVSFMVVGRERKMDNAAIFCYQLKTPSVVLGTAYNEMWADALLHSHSQNLSHPQQRYMQCIHAFLFRLTWIVNTHERTNVDYKCGQWTHNEWLSPLWTERHTRQTHRMQWHDEKWPGDAKRVAFS